MKEVRLEDLSQLHRELRQSLGYISPCLKRGKEGMVGGETDSTDDSRTQHLSSTKHTWHVSYQILGHEDLSGL